MVSTMALPHQVSSLPTYPGPPVTGPPNPMGGPFYGNPHVVLQHQIIHAGQIVNGTNTEAPLPTQTYNTVRVPMIPVGGGCYNDGMQVVWHGEFSRHFSQFFPPYHWYLSITETKPPGKWKCHGDSAKVRFCCQDCGNGWTSMKGRVTFWYNFNHATNAGFVHFKLYGQVCQKCDSGRFEFVMWYPEEVAKVMYNLYSKVGHAYYGFPPTQIRVDRRPGRPRNQHNADLCQACRDGECDQGRPGKAVISYLPTDMTHRVHNNQILPVVNPQMPVLVAQPTMPHCGQVITHQPNPSAAGSMVPCHTNQPNYITAPVTISSSMQPTLTYTVGPAEVKEPLKLSTVEEHTEDNEGTESDIRNGHCAENDVGQTATTEVKPLPKPDTETTKSPISKPLDDTDISPKTTSLPVTAALAKLQISGVRGKSPVKTGNDVSPKKATSADKISKESSSSEANGNVPEKPTMNGYATAARKVVPKPLLVNGNA